MEAASLLGRAIQLRDDAEPLGVAHGAQLREQFLGVQGRLLVLYHL
jgi:hypothetical protein